MDAPLPKQATQLRLPTAASSHKTQDHGQRQRETNLTPDFGLPSGIFIVKNNTKPAIDTIWHAIERNDINAVNEFIAKGHVNLRYAETIHKSTT